MAMVVRVLFVLFCVASISVAEPTAGYDRVAVAPAKTSIYVGTVSMTMSVFTRQAAGYESAYVAKLFPYFFANESGRLFVEMSAEQLHTLARGEPIEFRGYAVNTDGSKRRVEGKATPLDATSGKLKVRVYVSKRVELIFNTTYRFIP